MATSTIVNPTESTQSNLRTCVRCGLTYDWRRSPSSSLKMTYCGALCEKGDLGFTIEALLRAEIPKREAEELPEPVAPLVAA